MNKAEIAELVKLCNEPIKDQLKEGKEVMSELSKNVIDLRVAVASYKGHANDTGN